MATDFGDESGEKLFDWMLRVGQEAGQEALAKSAKGLAEAIRSTCAGIEKSEGSGGAAAKTTEWAKLSMREFEDLPEYETLADMISSQLKKEGVEHAFANEGGKRFLVFKAKETPSVARAFRRIEESIPEACERAKGVLAKGEPLKERAARARAAAEQIAQKADKPREIEIAHREPGGSGGDPALVLFGRRWLLRRPHRPLRCGLGRLRGVGRLCQPSHGQRRHAQGRGAWKLALGD